MSTVSEVAIEESSDRIVVKLDPGGPVELTDLTASFAGLARYYGRHHHAEAAGAPKLYVARLETGSIIAEIVPLVVMMGAMVPAMDATLVVTEFTRRLIAGIKAFADPTSPLPEPVSSDDAADLRAFVRPLTGKPGSSLGIAHARFFKNDGKTTTVAEYTFNEAELNRATVNIDQALARHELLPAPDAQAVEQIQHEVMLNFEQASARPGKESGRTGDKGIVSIISPKALPVYFRSGFQDLKEKMIRGEINPLNHVFVVDVYVQRVDGDPKGYVVTDVHKVMPIDEGE